MPYDVAHQAGLSLEEEYELLGLLKKEFKGKNTSRGISVGTLPVIAKWGGSRRR